MAGPASLAVRRGTPDSIRRLSPPRAFLGQECVPAPVQTLSAAPWLHEDGAPRVLATRQEGPSLPATLHEFAARPLTPQTCAATLRRCAAAVHALHRSGRVHRHLSPRRIKIDGAVANAVLDEPGADGDWFATYRAEDLPYAAPELLQPTLQADHRADLYALGAILFELLTGAPPFAADDLLGWIHAHVAQAPRSPIERDRRIPAALAEITLKLLAKSADERYQSAAGLIADLDRHLADCQRGEPDRRFPLGEHDVPEELRISQKLYGRAAELQVLEAARERVAQRGAPELVLVRGPSGIGKSALVRALQRSAAGAPGFYVAGKFDQYKRDVPYATLVQAFGELARQLLAASEERLAVWRERLRGELGNLGQLIVDVVPQMELVIGPQPPVPPQPLLEAQNRFNRVLRQFIGVFAQAEHPLILFLDDLQWADTASVRLLQHLLTHPDVRHVLVICAYRDGEIGPSHPWTAALADIGRSEIRISDVAVEPLPPSQVALLLADTLRCPAAPAAELADLLHARTAGNPFFVGQFLGMLAAEGLLRLDPEARAWRWDLAAIAAKGYTDNIVELMLDRLRGLPRAAQRALSLLACVGAEVAPATLAGLLERSEAEVLADLAPALGGSLIGLGGGLLQFAHDRVQQAAYSLTPEAERAGVHLRIGRELRGPVGSEVPADRLFDVVNHLNAAAARITDPAERADLATLDLQAGRRAKQANAYASARIYLRAALALLPADAWDSYFEVCFDLHRSLSECEYLCNDTDAAQQLFAAALAHARDTVDRAEIHALQIALYYSVGRMQDCLTVGQQALRELGVDIPDTPEARGALFGPLLAAVMGRFAALDIDALEHPTLVVDPTRQVIAQVLVNLIPPAYYLDIVLFSLIILRLVESSLVHGETADSVVGYSSFALLLVTVVGDHELAGRIARMTLRRLDTIPDPATRTKIHTIWGWFTGPWHEPLPQLLGHLRAGYQAGVEAGDLTTYGAFALLGQDTLLLCRGDGIDPIIEQFTRHRATYVQMQHEIAVATVDVVAAQLPRLAAAASVLEPELPPGPGVVGSALGTHHFLRMQRLLVLGDVAGTLAAAEQFIAAKPSGLLGTFLGADGDFYTGLVAAAALVADDTAASADPPIDRDALLARLRGLSEQFAGLAARCPENFLARAELLAAELARCEGRLAEALPRLEAAARSAAANTFLAVEALACERAGEVARALGLDVAAAAYYERAHQLYTRWGARAKALQLETRTPELARRPADAAPQWLSIDALAIVKATQTLSGELVQERLLGNLMRVVLEHAGAQTGHLLLLTHDRLVVAAIARTGAQDVELTLPSPHPAVRGDDLALSIVQYVRRTREHVLLADAAADPTFAGDPYLARAHVRSALCLPIVRSGALLGVLYLENNWMTGAFTPQRIAVLDLLLAQAAISLEVTTLYADLDRENRERRAIEQGLRESEERLRRLAEDAQRQLDIIAAQQDAIRQLSTPIIEVWHGVVMMPLFGSIDHAQASQMQETLLEAITRTRARAAILDLTGVGVVDTTTAQHIIGLVHAVQLLGARGIIVGIRPDVAQSIVSLGVDLARIITLSNLREALVLCMQQIKPRPRT
jgi:anti-anti-sigma factor